MGSVATTYYPTNINVPRFDWASTAVVNGNLAVSSDLNFVANLGSTGATAAVTAPDGSATVYRMSEGTNNGGHNFTYGANNWTLTAGLTYEISFYVKYNGRQYIVCNPNIGYWAKFYAIFDTQNGLVSSTSGTGTAAISDAGGGWYRCSCIVSATGSGTGTFAAINGNFLSTSNVNSWDYLGDGTSGVYFFGLQVAVGSSLTAYKPTGAQVPTNTPLAANTTCNGLLIEESRTNRLLWCRDATSGTPTNLLLYSEQFGNGGGWTTTNVSVLDNQTTSPTGTTTADLIAETTTNGNHILPTTQYITYTSGVTYTFSMYVKKGSGANAPDIIQTTFPSAEFGTGQYANFDISVGGATSGTVTYSIGGTASISDAGSGWYRISWTATCSSSGTPRAYNALVFCNNNSTAARAPSYAGQTTADVFVWGAQMVPFGFLTNYQLTTTAATYGWSTSNVTVAKDQTGVDGVANAATKITASSDNGVLIQPMLLASGSRTGSVYLKRITGTGNVQVSLDGSTWSTVDLSSTEWRRIVLSGTVTNPTIGIRLATNGDAVAMDYGQIEDGAFATSPILTTTATVTRSADAASIGGPLFFGWFNQSLGTFNATAYRYQTIVANTILSINNSGNNDQTGWFGIYIGTGNLNEAVQYGPSFVNLSSTLSLGYTKISFSYNNSNPFFVASKNGGLPLTFSSTSNQNTFKRAMWIGNLLNTGGSYLGGCITRISYVPYIVSPSGVQNVSSLST